ncbi:regulatory protein RecX [uncultured Abyssibacter sp.]|uniref:regulatory protein RecX n=1 Tax=uncultured Abyssibacter sp. TaxID=2320202 RepID=UPI0032B1E5A6
MSSDAETDPAEIRDKAITLLAAREHSAAELRRKLARHFDDRDAVDAVLVELASDGYQSDVRFAEARVRASLNRGHGPLMIRQKLQAAGVEAGLIEQVMEALDVDWPEEARAILDSKFGSRPAADRRETARRARFLASRGFSSDVIGRLLLD